MKLGILGLLTALLLLCGCEFGSAPGGGGTGGEGLSGILVDAQGAPLASIQVRVYPGMAALSKGARAYAARPESTTTNADGRFLFAKLPAGRYNLEASFTRQDTTFSIFIPGIDFVKTLDLGQDTLRVSGSLRILVRDLDQTPLAGADCAIPGSPWTARSDSTGHCVFSALAPGNYRVAVSRAPLAPTVSPAVPVMAGQEARGEASLLPVMGEGVTANWIQVSDGGSVFFIPPDFRIESDYSGIDSRFAFYRGASTTLRIESGFVMRLARPDSLPEYQVDTLELDSNTRAYHVSYLDSTGYVAGTEIETRHIDIVFLVIFRTLSTDAAAQARAQLILRSIRTWNGTGPAPQSPPPVPVLREPAQSAEVSATPALSWAASVGDLGYSNLIQHYRLQVSLDSAFASLAVNDSVPAAFGQNTEVAVRTVGPLGEGELYYWRVISAGPGGRTSSGTRSFRTYPSLLGDTPQ